MQPPNYIKAYSYTFRLKQGLKLSILGRKLQKFFGQGDMKTPKIIFRN